MENEMTPRERQQIYDSEHEAILKRLKLGIMYVIDFPNRRTLPILSRIALWIVARQGGRAAARYTDLSK